jgi:hypothetical protein
MAVAAMGTAVVDTATVDAVPMADTPVTVAGPDMADDLVMVADILATVVDTPATAERPTAVLAAADIPVVASAVDTPEASVVGVTWAVEAATWVAADTAVVVTTKQQQEDSAREGRASARPFSFFL